MSMYSTRAGMNLLAVTCGNSVRVLRVRATACEVVQSVSADGEDFQALAWLQVIDRPSRGEQVRL